MKCTLWFVAGALAGLAGAFVGANITGQSASAESATVDSSGITTGNVIFCSCLGDANGDGVVSFADITAVLGNWLNVCAVDADGDGFDNTVDCNDFDNTIFPGAPELCDGIDNNCDGIIDENCDLDQDGFTVADGDCDDFNPNVHPAAIEVCNGIDDDCDGVVDEGFNLVSDINNCGSCGLVCPQVPNATTICSSGSCLFVCMTGFIDFDGDPLNGCEAPDADADGWPPPFDCDDSDPTINPTAIEICGDGIDNNCDGQVDEGCP